MAKVAVYGTLRQGQSNHYYLRDEKFVGEFESEPVFGLYSLGSYPGLKEKGNTSVKMEVYEVDEHKMRQLDNLEGYRGDDFVNNLYNKKNIVTPFGIAKLYVYNHDVSRKSKIESGDWVEHINLNKTNKHVQNSN